MAPPGQVLGDLGQDVAIFGRPVDPKIAPDYYTVVKNPIDLGTIKRRLERRTYPSPQDFCEVGACWLSVRSGGMSAAARTAVSCRPDLLRVPCAGQDLRRVWTNCHIYNKRDSYVGKVGARASALFEQLWAGSGYNNSHRHKRLGAGIAARKYEPALDSGDKKAKKGLVGKGSQRTGGRGQVGPAVARLLCLGWLWPAGAVSCTALVDAVGFGCGGPLLLLVNTERAGACWEVL